MVTKPALVLLFAGACLAYPADEEVRPPNGQIQVVPSQPLSVPPEDSRAPLPGALPENPLPSGQPLPPPQGPLPEENPDKSDLKTDNTFWWRRTYYPSRYYSRYYYRPRSYSTYSYYTPYYSYWNPYYWW